MKLSDPQIFRAMQLLGVQQTDFRSIETAASFDAGVQQLEALKLRVKKQFRKLALELHPDRTNNDPAKTEDFKLVSAVVDEIDRLVFRPPPPPPQLRVVRIQFNTTVSTGSTGATTVSWSGFRF